MVESSNPTDDDANDDDTLICRPEHIHYDHLEQWIRGSIAAGEKFLFDSHLFHKELTGLWERFEIPYECLFSFYRNIHLEHIKKKAYRIRAAMPQYLNEYKRGRTILDLAQAANFSPHLLARYLVDDLRVLRKDRLADAMRDPLGVLGGLELSNGDNSELEAATLASRLAIEVELAQEADPLYGPMHDAKRHMIGVEFELVLEHYLERIDVPFETEADLRGRGTSKTPDVLLSMPLAIQVSNDDGSGWTWKVISWIDSKAMFGDVVTHHTSVLPQAETYVNRFGPGLIMYWFGHAPLARLSDANGDIVIAGWNLPRQFMLPTGEILSSVKVNAS